MNKNMFFWPAVYTPETDVYTKTIQHQNAVIGEMAQRLTQVENKSYQKMMDEYQKAFLKEATRYEQISFFVDPSTRPCISLQNHANHSIVKLLSNCYDFHADYGLDPESEERTIHLVFYTEQGNQRELNIRERDYNPTTLYNRFFAQGGSVCYSKQRNTSANMFFCFVSSLLANAPAEAVVPGWQCHSGCWQFHPEKDGKWHEPLLYCNDLEDGGRAAYALARVYGALKGRLPQDVYLSRPICLVGIPCPQDALSLNDLPKEFSQGLDRKKYQPWVFIGPEAVYTYRSKTNMAELVARASSGTSTVYFVCSQTLTPLQRDHCLVIDVGEKLGGEPFHQVKLSDLMTMIEKNPDVFDNTVAKAYKSALDFVDEDSSVKHDLVALIVVSYVIYWYFSCTIETEQETKMVTESLQSILSAALTQCEEVNTEDILPQFRNALYTAKRERKLYVEPLKCASGDGHQHLCMYYDDSYYYISVKLLKQIFSEYLPEFQSSHLILALEEAGVMGKSVKRYLKTESGCQREMRFRPLSRAGLRVPGQRELASM